MIRVSLVDLLELAGIAQKARSPQTKQSLAIQLVHGLAQFCPLPDGTVDTVIVQLQNNIGMDMTPILSALDSANLGTQEMIHFHDTIHREEALTQILDRLVHARARKTQQASLSPQVADTIYQLFYILDTIYLISSILTSLVLAYYTVDVLYYYSPTILF